MGGFIARQLYHTGAFKTDLGISAQMPRYMQMIRGFPGGSDGKESHAGDLGLIPGSRRSSGKENGAWQGTVHGIAKSLTPLSN